VTHTGRYGGGLQKRAGLETGGRPTECIFDFEKGTKTLKRFNVILEIKRNGENVMVPRGRRTGVNLGGGVGLLGN